MPKKTIVTTTVTTTVHDDGTVTSNSDTTTNIEDDFTCEGGVTTLSNGQKMPLIGLGTWQAKAGEVGEAVRTAIEEGCRHIDCAACYGNETEVGETFAALFAEGKIRRDELFVTSKLWNSEHCPEHVLPAVQMTLRDLQLDYLDLYIIHWPQAFQHVDGTNRSFPRNDDGSMKYDLETSLTATWAALEKLVDSGLVKAIGLSNFNKAQVQEIVSAARIKPVCNQVESHPFFQQNDLVEFCTANGVQVTAYSPLGSGAEINGVKVMNHPALSEIGQKYGLSAAQVAIAFQVNRGIPTFPKSVKAERIKQNLAAGSVKLSETDMDLIAKIDAGKRCGWGGPLVERDGRKEPRDVLHPNYPFTTDVPAGGL